MGSLEFVLKRNTAPASDSLPAAANDPSADIFARWTGESRVNVSDLTSGLFESREKT